MKRKKAITDTRVGRATGWVHQIKGPNDWGYWEQRGTGRMTSARPHFTTDLSAIVDEITNLDRDGIMFCWDYINQHYGPTGQWVPKACCDALLHWLEDK
jgi:hypothetical protein